MSSAQASVASAKQAALDTLLPDATRQLEAFAGGDLCNDSRRVAPGDIFLALPGAAVDGRQYIAEALSAGACLVLAEAQDGLPGDDRVLAVSQLRDKLPDLVKGFYRDPSSGMSVLAVTGTNGKTSVVEFTGQLLRALGVSTGCIGTLGARTESRPASALNTTPDLLALTRQLRSWLDVGVNHVAMEASSHALAQGRLLGMQLHSACFTNLSRDHLDYHGSVEEYAAAKLSLFTDFGLTRAIYNADDAIAARVAEIATAEVVGISCADPGADVLVEISDPTRFALDLKTPWGETTVAPSLSGRFNAFNVAAAITGVVGMGFAFNTVCDAANDLCPIPGRMERFTDAQGFQVVVDYAHTPDALENALRALKPETIGRLWVVFGCGGDRDTGKRPMMGEVACHWADEVIVTSDNPRGESPELIARDILQACNGNTRTELDRESAIAVAMAGAASGDTILVAGKGHEDYQEVSGVRTPFDDREVVLRLLRTEEVVR